MRRNKSDGVSSIFATYFLFQIFPQMDFLCCPRDYSSPWQPSTPPAVITWVRYYMEKSFLMCSTLQIAHTVTLELDCSHKRKTEFEQLPVPFKFISSYINPQNSALWLHYYYLFFFFNCHHKATFCHKLSFDAVWRTSELVARNLVTGMITQELRGKYPIKPEHSHMLCSPVVPLIKKRFPGHSVQSDAFIKIHTIRPTSTKLLINNKRMHSW